jgi:hypothetical protein
MTHKDKNFICKEATSGMKIAVSDTDHIKNDECKIYYLWIV